MMYRKLILLQIVLCSFAVSFAQKNDLKVFVKDKNALVINKAKLKSGNENLIPAFKKLIKDADQLLSKAPTSVMEKKQTPPSGDMHDYMSLAIYFWPDPSKPDGSPRKSMDSTRIHQLGWKATMGLEDGLKITYEFLILQVCSQGTEVYSFSFKYFY